MKRWFGCAAALVFVLATAKAQNLPFFHMGYSGAGIGADLLKAKPDLARAILREGNAEAEVGPLYERLRRSFRDFPAPEVRGIQNVIDSLPTPKARAARAEDFMDTSLMEEIRKSGFHEKPQGK